MTVRFLLKEDARTVGLCNPHYLYNVNIFSVTNDPNHNHGNVWSCSDKAFYQRLPGFYSIVAICPGTVQTIITNIGVQEFLHCANYMFLVHVPVKMTISRQLDNI